MTISMSPIDRQNPALPKTTLTTFEQPKQAELTIYFCIFHESLKIKLLAFLTVASTRLQVLTHQSWSSSLSPPRLLPL